MSHDQNRPRPSSPPEPDGAVTAATAVKETPEPEKKTSDRPSATQLTAGALAAVTTTSLASYLGVAGTIIGAALSSIVTVLGSYIYTTSLRRTADRVSAAAPLVRARALGTRTTTVMSTRRQGATHGPRPRSETGSPTRVDDGATVAAAQAGAAAQPEDGKWRAAWRAVVERYGYRRLVAMVLGVFVVIIGAVTLVEVAAGKPLSDVVRNEQGSGTTIGVSSGTTSRETPAAPATPGQGPSEAPSSTPGPGSTPTPAPTATTAPGEPTPAPTQAPEPSPAPGETPAPEQSPAPQQPAPAPQQQAPQQAPTGGAGQPGTAANGQPEAAGAAQGTTSAE
ncbi:hypothetical protein [Georgenia thermotolerans]|uniref:Uncharacterized protein n=1 Tax=Georgenia thermotolerans TaxID=527326 RepID=A0A7J5UU45_9MICO|nr:hypothetical protein [Georgenia thermotolerans]KAE8765796.1 hypothetical protein GB883_01685 [Georgenia thermotolerans]